METTDFHETAIDNSMWMVSSTDLLERLIIQTGNAGVPPFIQFNDIQARQPHTWISIDIMVCYGFNCPNLTSPELDSADHFTTHIKVPQR